MCVDKLFGCFASTLYECRQLFTNLAIRKGKQAARSQGLQNQGVRESSITQVRRWRILETRRKKDLGLSLSPFTPYRHAHEYALLRRSVVRTVRRGCCSYSRKSRNTRKPPSRFYSNCQLQNNQHGQNIRCSASFCVPSCRHELSRSSRGHSNSCLCSSSIHDGNGPTR